MTALAGQPQLPDAIIEKDMHSSSDGTHQTICHIRAASRIWLNHTNASQPMTTMKIAVKVNMRCSE